MHGKPESDDDTFEDVWFDAGKDATAERDGATTNLKERTDFYDQWIEKASAKHSGPEIFIAHGLRKVYPKHSLVMTSMNVLNFPGVVSVPLEKTPLITNTIFAALPQRSAIPGVLIDNVEYGSFRLAWDKSDFLLFTVTWPVTYGSKSQHYILHEGSDEPARALLLAAGVWANVAHDEIWVFNQGFWRKDHALWESVQVGNWKDVILKDEFKKALKKDIYGFFKSEALYKQFAIPWKRGIIMHGPPGNGKTISIKTIMKECDALGFTPLYVKSFQSYMGEEGSMAAVFSKARQLSPCVIILEDLDSLINNSNRSFFLNQLDGLEGNDGLLVIGTTNHFDQLDPGLSTRPSRFDRKYLFDDPDREERALYAQYWQDKLKVNEDIAFPDSLVGEVADATAQFSFAYLKEAFVSSLVTLAGWDGDDKPSFATALKGQIRLLRKQLDKSPNTTKSLLDRNPLLSKEQVPDNSRDIRTLLDALSDSLDKSAIGSPRIFSTVDSTNVPGNRDIRALLDALSDSISKSEALNIRSQWLQEAADGGNEFRALLDRMLTLRDGTASGGRYPFERNLETGVRGSTSSQTVGRDLNGRVYRDL